MGQGWWLDSTKEQTPTSWKAAYQDEEQSDFQQVPEPLQKACQDP